MKTKKIVSLLLSLAVMLTSLSLLCVGVSAVEVQNQIDIPEEATTYELDGVTYTVVRTAAQMNELAVTNASGGVKYILDADLDYTTVNDFKPIQLNGGSFNGNGHSITGVTINYQSATAPSSSAPVHKGIFEVGNASTAGTATISNLIIGSMDKKVVVSAVAGEGAAYGRIGALVGYTYNNSSLTVENVAVYADVTATNFRTGGMIGEARGTLIMKNCAFYGTVTVNGTQTSTGSTSYAAGGFFGYSYGLKVTMENCANYGNIKHLQGYAGGLMGAVTNTANLTNCANYGNITGGTIGGLIGTSGPSTKAKVTMNNCFNAGEVTGTTHTGGLVGACSQDADYFTKLNYSANIGNLTGTNVNDLAANVVTDSSYTVATCGSYGAQNTLTDTAAALTFMQTNCSYAMFGIEDNKIVVKTVPAEAKFLQYKKDAEANTMDIRVLGVINASVLSKYENVGFNVSIYNADENKAKVGDPIGTYAPFTTTVYESVNANEGGTITTYSALDLGATYLYALELQNIPMTGSYVFEITAFATETEAEGGATVSDSVVTVTVVDGKIQ